MEQEFKDGINLNTDLNIISKQICRNYDLGEYISDTIITVGYEDFNYILETTKGKYCVKIFNKERTDEDCKNYIDRIELASEIDINTPKLYKANSESECIVEVNGIKFRLCVFEYINGSSFFDLEIIPNEDEIKEIIRQMAIIHKQQLNSEFIYDKWAIVNFIEEFEDKKIYLSKEDYKKLSELLAKFKNIDMKSLPYAFTHGDIISTNVMRDNNGKLWIIDFAVSNCLPRIVDLAVSSCNLCLNPDSIEETKSKIENDIKSAVAVTTRNESVSYNGYNSEIEEGSTYSGVFTFLFLFIAILSVTTTMNRFVKKQRTTIGTLKALGFKNRKITKHYISYGFYTSLFASILGIICGRYTIGEFFLYNEMTYFEIPTYKTVLIPTVYILAFLVVIVITIVTEVMAVEVLLLDLLLKSLLPTIATY